MQFVRYLPFLLPCSAGLLAAATPTYEVATWKGNAQGAVSVSFDDSLTNQFEVGVPILNERQIPGTFFLITDIQDWDAARAAALQGHEMGSHSTDGQRLTSKNDPASFLSASKTKIETEIGQAIPGYQALTLGWPFGDWGYGETTPSERADYINAAIASFIAGRGAGNNLGANNSYNAANPSSWWAPAFDGLQPNAGHFVIGDALVNGATTIQAFEDQLQLVVDNNAWTVFTYHGLDGGGNLHVSSASFTAQMDALAARDDIWKGTVADVFRYARQREAAQLQLTESSDASLTFSLTDSLDDSIYNVPLTLRVSWPGGGEVTAQQGENALPVSVEGDWVQFDAVPDQGSIVLSRSLSGYAKWAADNQVTGGAGDTPDGDNVSNLMKYALGLTPGMAARADQLPQVANQSNGSLDFTFTAVPDHTDIVYSVEGSNQLTGWTEVWNSDTSGSPTLSEQTQLTGITGYKFLRLRVYLK